MSSPIKIKVPYTRPDGENISERPPQNHVVIIPRKTEINAKIASIRNLKVYSEAEDKEYQPDDAVIEEARRLLFIIPSEVPLPKAQFYLDGGISFFWEHSSLQAGFSFYGDGLVDCALKIKGETIYNETTSLEGQKIKDICSKLSV